MRTIFGALACAALSACGGSNAPEEKSEALAAQDITGGTTDPGNAAERAESEEPTPRAKEEAKQASQPVSCQPKETPIFSCKVESGKSAAVCASEGGAQYRFGKDTSELTLTDGQWATTPYSGGGEAQIAFSNGDTRYIVFSRMVRTNFTEGEPNNPAISDGVIVERGGNVISVQKCGGADLLPIQYFEAEEHLPMADDLFTYETGRADF